jgi:uncharacterized Zn finger protein
MSYPRYYPPARPRAVTGGLTARSARGQIGSSWWSRRFLTVLESFALGTRLTRGRAYARRGQVISLEVLPGVVTARVQGTRATPYRVAIGFAPFTDATWAEVDAALAGQALFTAQLLAGEVPQELEGLLADLGAPLFPTSVRQIRMACSCPDSAVPCKHLAATFYLLAERFDDDPFAMLHWRGRSRQVLLDRLRELRDGGNDAGERAGDGAGPDGPPGSRRSTASGTALALADLMDDPADLDLDRYWHVPVPLPEPVPSLDVPVDLLLSQLPEPPRALGGPALTEWLRPLYRRLAERSDP